MNFAGFPAGFKAVAARFRDNRNGGDKKTDFCSVNNFNWL